MSYAIKQDGSSWRAINQDSDIGQDEILSVEQPILVISNLNVLKEQLLLLEQEQTPRRLREAILGIDDGWLLNLNNQIITIRNQLK
jgi:hypothetical protein